MIHYNAFVAFWNEVSHDLSNRFSKGHVGGSAENLDVYSLIEHVGSHPRHILLQSSVRS